MSIILDFNQVCIANLMQLVSTSSSVHVDEDLLRHMCLNTIRFNLQKFRNTHGALILATDARNTWRKEAYPFYKANRAKTRDESPINWDDFFRFFTKIVDEIRDNFVYPVLSVDRAEGDDIIGVLARYISTVEGENVLILSGDKDFKQLINDKISQYNPIAKEPVVHNDPKFYLFRHVVKGDSNDGVPNIRSDDDALVMKKRQLPIRETTIEQWYHEGIPDEHQDKYQRNKTLIDLSSTPVEIVKDVVRNYKSQKNKHSNVFDYLYRYNLAKLNTSAQEF